MRILQVSTTDHGGGGAKVPWDLFRAYRDLGHRSMLAVGYRRGLDNDDSDIFEIPNDRFRSAWSKLLYRGPAFMQQHRLRGETWLRHALIPLAEPNRAWKRNNGLEDFDFPATHRLLDLAPVYPDILHCHNLHGEYFDLRTLPELSKRVPLILTLHDMWPLTGHCGHSMQCDRWRSGCGECPDLTIYPAITRDSTAENWQMKKDIFSHTRLFISTPSRWLMEQVQQSILRPTECRIIPNGIDLGIFRQWDKLHARATLGLPSDAHIILFSGSRAQENPFKDYATIELAIQEIAKHRSEKPLIFLHLGGREDKVIDFGHYKAYFYAFRNEQKDVATFYQAADIFLHAANAETFGLVIVEALACGVPVVATAVGGICELIQDGLTGFLTPQADAYSMAQHAIQLLLDESRRLSMGQRAADSAKQDFDLRQQVNSYLSWYEEIRNLV